MPNVNTVTANAATVTSKTWTSASNPGTRSWQPPSGCQASLQRWPSATELLGMACFFTQTCLLVAMSHTLSDPSCPPTARNSPSGSYAMLAVNGCVGRCAKSDASAGPVDASVASSVASWRGRICMTLQHRSECPLRSPPSASWS